MALVKIGGGWSKKSKTGEPFISLDIQGRKMLLYKNKNKEKDTHPDYVVKEVQDDVPATTPVPTEDIDVPF